MKHQPPTVSLSEQADKLIQDYAFGSSLTGFIPIPMVDTFTLISVQRLMLMQMSKLYGIPFSRHLAKAWLSTLMGGIAPKMATPMVGSFLKLIPGIGTLVGGATTAALGGASTHEPRGGREPGPAGALGAGRRGAHGHHHSRSGAVWLLPRDPL